MRPVFRPGTHVVRRTADRLQVGLHPRRALPLTADHDIGETLAAISTASRPIPGPTTAALAGRGLLVDGDALLASLSHLGPAATARATVASLACEADDPGRALRARGSCRVGVARFGCPELSGSLGSELLALLSRAGVGSDPRRPRSGPDLVLAVGVGEPRRTLADGWMREGTPHLFVRIVENRAVVGPFVAPGESCCLRCLDAHRTDDDPAWPLVVEQYASATARPRPDGVPEPVDPLLATLALAWAARDAATYAQGGRPSTWSATVQLDGSLAAANPEPVLRHPACGCAWG